MQNAILQNKKIIIYGYGITGKWLSRLVDCEVIIDTDLKKWGSSLNGLKVRGPDFFNIIEKNDYIVIITTVDIFDVIPLLNNYNMKWIPLTHLVDVNNYELINNQTGESDKFLKYSIDTVLECQNAAFKEDSFYIRSIDLVITEKCTLKCKDCANLMQFYTDPVNYDQNKILEGIIELASKTKFIHEIRIIGGEPFLNKQIYSIIKKVSSITNINKIIVYTNGMIPPSEEELKYISKEKLLFSITDYAELGKNLSKTIAILERNNFSFRLHPPEHWTDSGRILNRNDDIDFAKELFAKCCGKNLFTLIDNNLYRCPFAANAEKLNAIPIDNSNSVKVSDTINNIRNFAYEISYMDACMYCPGRSFDAPQIIPAIQSKKPIEYQKIIPIQFL